MLMEFIMPLRLRHLFAATLLATSLSANATTDSYGTLLAGSFQPSDTFATLTYSNVGNLYSFTLSALDLDTLFTPDAFIGAIAVDAASQPVVSNVSGDTVVSVSPGGGPTGTYDFRFDLTGPKQARLTANESVSFDALFSQAVSLNSSSFALHVQGLTDNNTLAAVSQGGSAWYTSSPEVPEPGTYAMMMLGLGLMGFVAKHKRS